MGKGSVRITKQKWFKKDEGIYKDREKASNKEECIYYKKVNGTKEYIDKKDVIKVVLYKDATKALEKENSIYYYINDKNNKQYVSNKEVKRQFIDENRGRASKILNEEKVLKFPRPFYKDENNKFKRMEEGEFEKLSKDKNLKLYRRFKKENKKKNNLYKDSDYIEKTSKDNKTYCYCEMIEEERVLTINRCKAVLEINKEYKSFIDDVKQRLINDNNELIIDYNKLKSLYNSITNYKLDKKCNNNEIIKLKDKNSTKREVIEKININKNIGEIILKLLLNNKGISTNKENKKPQKSLQALKNIVPYYEYGVFKQNLMDYLMTQNMIINSTLGISVKNKEREEKNKYSVNIDNVSKKVECYLKKYNYECLESKITKQFKNNQDNYKKIITQYNKDIYIFNTIKEHYKSTFEYTTYDFWTEESKFYIKEIHYYILGRAKKIRQNAISGNYETYEDCKDLFNEETIKKKIIRKIINKKVLNDVSNGKLKYYGVKDKNLEISKQLINILETFNKKLNPLVHEAIVTGISEVREGDEIYGANSYQKIEENINKYLNKNYIEERAISNFEDRIVYLKGAYFLRNYSLHKQSLANKDSDENVIKFKKLFKSNINASSKNVSNNLIEYELDKLKFNNCIKYISKEDIKKVLEKIDINAVKPSYIPRSKKVYNQLNLGIIEKYKEEPEKESAIFYLLKLLYEQGFDNIIKDCKFEPRLQGKNDKEKEIENKMISNIKEALSKGLYEYRQENIILKQGDEGKIRSFEKYYTRMIARMFEEIIINLEIKPEELIKEISDTDKSYTEEYIEKQLQEKIEQNDFHTENLFIISIYSTAKLGDISTMSSFKQAIDRYLSLIESLYLKYGEDNVNDIYKTIIEKDNIVNEGEDLNNELENLKKQLDVEIKLYSYKMNKANKDFEVGKDTDLLDEILRAFKSEYEQLSDIKYNKTDKSNEKKEVALWQQGIESRSTDKIINSKFIIEEQRQRTLKYLIDLHVYALENVGLKYTEILDEISKFNDRNKNEYKAIYEILNINKNDINNKNYIDNLMHLRNEIYKYFKENNNCDKENENINNLFENLKNINHEINKYNFYSRLVTLEQLQVNKKFLKAFNTRFYTWTYQGEKTGMYMLINDCKNNGNNKKNKLEKIKIVAEKNNNIDDFSFEKFRNEVSHLNLLQAGSYEMYIKKQDKTITKVNDVEYKSYDNIYKNFLTFNKYETKKLNETPKLEGEILKKFNIELTKEKTFKPRTKEIRIVEKSLNNICEEEAKYMETIYKHVRVIGNNN